jgi:hypothetical protein
VSEERDGAKRPLSSCARGAREEVRPSLFIPGVDGLELSLLSHPPRHAVAACQDNDWSMFTPCPAAFPFGHLPTAPFCGWLPLGMHDTSKTPLSAKGLQPQLLMTSLTLRPVRPVVLAPPEELLSNHRGEVFASTPAEQHLVPVTQQVISKNRFLDLSFHSSHVLFRCPITVDLAVRSFGTKNASASCWSAGHRCCLPTEF